MAVRLEQERPALPRRRSRPSRARACHRRDRSRRRGHRGAPHAPPDGRRDGVRVRGQLGRPAGARAGGPGKQRAHRGTLLGVERQRRGRALAYHGRGRDIRLWIERAWAALRRHWRVGRVRPPVDRDRCTSRVIVRGDVGQQLHPVHGRERQRLRRQRARAAWGRHDRGQVPDDGDNGRGRGQDHGRRAGEQERLLRWTEWCHVW